MAREVQKEVERRRRKNSQIAVQSTLRGQFRATNSHFTRFLAILYIYKSLFCYILAKNRQILYIFWSAEL